MVVSMTGFGSGKFESESFTVTVEMKSVNHRFSEYNIRMPREILKIEDKIKKKINGHVSRGRVEVFVTVEGLVNVNTSVHVNWNLIEDYYQALQAIQAKYDLVRELTIQDLVNRDEFITIHDDDSGNEELENAVIEAVETAVNELKQMRINEGENLARDVSHHIQLLSSKVQELKAYAPSVIQHYAERLKKRVEEFTNGVIDEARIVNEVAIFADKADINEELTRLESHIDQFQKNLKLHEPIGRKLDFLLQEMNREVNTIGSKANDSAIANVVVEMKSLLEKMKEQVQNIE